MVTSSSGAALLVLGFGISLEEARPRPLKEKGILSSLTLTTAIAAPKASRPLQEAPYPRYRNVRAINPEI
ncbi:hypothetical protein Hamer_G016341 [Homarus americanus]|uniref:Secreted protein n=1 Tax=Homarus americanus TaxID=6706 RepID=A0A8J5JUL8_HOMAM|nr:hypothetical protein Hamer_G016341 [Homarus americanus]